MLGSGSSGNATLVELGDTRILIDAGLGPRSLAERVKSAGVDPGSVSAVFLSHEHTDHARGAAAFSSRWGARVYGSRGTYAAAGLGALDISGYEVVRAGQVRRVGGLEVAAVEVPHDAAEPLAFVVSGGGAALGHATDFGHMSRVLQEAFRPCNAVLVESNYDPAMLRDGPYPWALKERILSSHGHLSNNEAARYLSDGLGAACRRVILAHVSRTNNHPELVLMAAEKALQRRAGPAVLLALTGPEGTDWIEVASESRPPRGGPGQLSLF